MMVEKGKGKPFAYNLMAVINLEQNKVAEAREVLVLALSASPDDTMTKMTLAHLEIKDGNLEVARSIYTDMLESRPGDALISIHMANLQARLGNLGEFIRVLKFSIDKNPQRIEPRLALARFYTLTGKNADVVEILGRVEKQFPRNIQVLELLAAAQLKTQDFDAAVDTSKQLISIQPQIASHYFLNAMASEGLGNLDAMKMKLVKTLQLNSSHYPAQLKLASLYLRQNELSSAENLIRYLVETRPDNSEVMALRGALSLKKNRPEDASKYYNSAFVVNPNSTDVITGLADSQLMSGDVGGAVATLVTSLKRQPNNIAVLARLANIYLIAKDEDSAILVLKKLNKLRPDDPGTMNSLAWLLRKDDGDAALAYAERANQLAPNNAAILDTLAMILLENGDVDRSLDIITQAAKRAPNNVSIGYHKALVLVKSGQESRARVVLQKLSIDETNSSEDAAKARDLLISLQ